MQVEHQVQYPKKPIRCLTISNRPDPTISIPDIVFTHGAGGTLESDAIANFAEGFASAGSTILCFQGNMNLQSRVKMFKAVLDSQSGGERTTCVGGRSMGSRAAIMAASTGTNHYALVSYPLHTEKDVRDEILLDIPKTARVIFVIGECDKMCQISRLDDVRKKMKCQTWKIVVEGADHGMAVKPKAGTKPVGLKTGEIVAQWLREDHRAGGQEGVISWDEESETAQWSGWQ